MGMIGMTSLFILSPCSPLPHSIASKRFDSEGLKKYLNGGLASLPLPSYHKNRHQIGPIAQLCEGVGKWVQANGCILANAVIVGALGFSISLCGLGRADAKEAMNQPELLPKEFTPLIDIAGFLSTSQESRIIQAITNLENDTGFKLRVLAQNYPNTPGIAVKDFWQVDDNTIVFVADPTFGNILNFNVGASVDLDIPRSFWSRLAGKYGNIFYWREKGEDASIEAAVSAITSCLREPRGPNVCSEIK